MTQTHSYIPLVFSVCNPVHVLCAGKQGTVYGKRLGDIQFIVQKIVCIVQVNEKLNLFFIVRVY